VESFGEAGLLSALELRARAVSATVSGHGDPVRALSERS
jgi:hypothetical protein